MIPFPMPPRLANRGESAPGDEATQIPWRYRSPPLILTAILGHYLVLGMTDRWNRENDLPYPPVPNHGNAISVSIRTGEQPRPNYSDDDILLAHDRRYPIQILPTAASQSLTSVLQPPWPGLSQAGILELYAIPRPGPRLPHPKDL